MTGKELKERIIKICNLNLPANNIKRVEDSIKKYESNIKKELIQRIKELESGKLTTGGILDKKLSSKRKRIEIMFNTYSRKQLISPCRANRDSALQYLAKLELLDDLISDFLNL